MGLGVGWSKNVRAQLVAGYAGDALDFGYALSGDAILAPARHGRLVDAHASRKVDKLQPARPKQFC